MREVIKSARLNEECVKIKHSSGLEILLYPMAGFTSAYALFATKYGSIDTRFKTGTDSGFVDVPAGIAHFLEHKMFESEDGDAFALYAKTGASANAYTSFDKTAYLFSCSENFEQSIEILLNLVTNPYFTAETVEKEQGIIGQEIKMYDDSPDWRVFFNLLGALYHNNPVNIDIAGTVDSIAKIDADLLYRCYNTFYNLNNMVLAIAGGFDPDVVLNAADRLLKKAGEIEIERGVFDEPESVARDRVEQHLPVSLPLFQIGFKGKPGTEKENVAGQVMDEILLEIIGGEASPLYRRLYDEGLINQTFSDEAMAGRDYTLCMFSGESRDPDKVFDEIKNEILLIGRDGLPGKAFDMAKKTVYGRYVGMFGRVDSVAGAIIASHFAGMGVYDILEIAAGVKKDDLEARIKTSFDASKSAISIIK